MEISCMWETNQILQRTHTQCNYYEREQSSLTMGLNSDSYGFNCAQSIPISDTHGQISTIYFKQYDFQLGFFFDNQTWCSEYDTGPGIQMPLSEM